jgi:hypothetical protein
MGELMFRWPWVSRTAYEDVREQLRDERDRTKKLTRIICRMKVNGGTLPRVPAGVRLPPHEPDPFERAIDENRHASRPQVRRALSAFVEREREKGTDAQLILRRLRTWDSVNAANTAADDDDEDTIAVVVQD